MLPESKPSPSAGPRAAPGPSSLVRGRNPLEVIGELTRLHGPVVRYSAGLGTIYLVTDPESVRRVLSQPERYPRSEVLRVVLGDGLLASEGPYWRVQRRRYQPRLAPERLADYARIMFEECEAMAAEWERHAAAGVVFDAARDTMRLSLSILGRTLLGMELHDADYKIGRLVTDVMVYLGHLGSTLPGGFSATQRRRVRESFAELDRVAQRVVDAAKGRPPGDDLLSALIAASKAEDGAAMTDKQLRDEVITIFLGGHETSGVMMGWACHLLARHPGVADRVAAEWEGAVGGRVPTLADFARLEYTRAVLDETLRLYPPVWSLVRKVLHDDELAGFHIEAGSHLMVSAYLMHRDPVLWEEPERFDPGRFLRENVARRPRHHYFPFGMGPHLCVGQHFALLEGAIMLGTLARRFRFEPAEDKPVAMLPLITIRPDGGIPLRLRPRKAS